MTGADAQGQVAKPLRTLLFSTLYPSTARPLNAVFVETRLRELLASGQVQTKVVAPVPWFWSTDPRHGKYAAMAATPRREIFHGIDVLHPRYVVLPKVGMNVTPFTLAIGAIGAIRSLQREGFDFDVIDAHYFYPDGVAAAMIASWLNKPLAITARGTDLNLIPQYRWPRRLIEWAARRSEASIGVCEALVDVLRGWGIPETKLHVMRNGVDLDRFRPHDRTAMRRELGIDGSPLLVSVGHLNERKGHHIAIAALAAMKPSLPDARLVIVGEGEERHTLQLQAARLGLAESVKLVGAVANESLAQWYSAADALLLGSSREGWPNVLLEAMACGTPVVASAIWGTPEVVTSKDVGRLVDRRSGEAFGAAVRDLLQAGVDRDAIRAYAEGFSWEATTQAQLRLFRRLARKQAA